MSLVYLFDIMSAKEKLLWSEIISMKNSNKTFIDYEKDGYLALWLCKTESKDILHRYLEIDYGDDEEESDIEDAYIVDFEMGRDFNIMWYDEDKLEFSNNEDMNGWNLLQGHSFIESILPALKENCKDVMDEIYNSVIIFYDFKYDGCIKEVKNNNYGYFKYIGSFEYIIK